MRWPDGSSFNGKWQAGEMHGAGTMTTPQGVVIVGTWVRDQL